MFSIFSLRRPNILPVRDLGVQRGVLRWVLSQHTNPSSPVKLSKKLVLDEETPRSQTETSTPDIGDASAEPTAATSVIIPPRTPTKKKKEDTGLPIPPPFTPSINRVLNAPVQPTPLPAGLTVAQLRSRLNGKNKVK